MIILGLSIQEQTTCNSLPPAFYDSEHTKKHTKSEGTVSPFSSYAIEEMGMELLGLNPEPVTPGVVWKGNKEIWGNRATRV